MTNNFNTKSKGYQKPGVGGGRPIPPGKKSHRAGKGGGYEISPTLFCVTGSNVLIFISGNFL